jgi:endonuclease III
VPFPDLRALREFYGLLPQPPADPFQFFLWEILSANALPARRDLAWQALRRIPALTPDAVFRTPGKALQDVVGLIGPHRDERIENIRATTGEFKRHRELFEAESFTRAGVRNAARRLRRLRHLPRETLERALLYAGGYAVLPLDDATARVVARLEGTAIPISDGAEGFTLKRARWGAELRRQRRCARKALAAVLPPDVRAYRDAVLYLRHHAQHTCIAVGPHCGVCPLATDCVFARSNSSRPRADAAP